MWFPRFNSLPPQSVYRIRYPVQRGGRLASVAGSILETQFPGPGHVGLGPGLFAEELVGHAPVVPGNGIFLFQVDGPAVVLDGFFVFAFVNPGEAPEQIGRHPTPRHLRIKAYRLAVILNGPGVFAGIEIGVAPGSVGLCVTWFKSDGLVELSNSLAIIPVAGVGTNHAIEKGPATVVMDPGSGRIVSRPRQDKRCGAGSAQQGNRE